jgi:hypothetical protein
MGYVISDIIAKVLYIIISFIDYLHESIIRFIKEKPIKVVWIIYLVYIYTRMSTEYQCNEFTITGWKLFWFILFTLIGIKYVIADYIIFIIKEQMAKYYILPMKVVK